RPPRGAGRGQPRPRRHSPGHGRAGGGGDAARRGGRRRRLGLGGGSARALPARPRRAALVPRPAAPLAGADVVGEPRLPAPPHHRHRAAEAVGVGRPRSLPEDQPRPRRLAPQGAGGLTSAPAPPAARALARNTIFSAIGEGTNALLFLLAFLAARLLGPEPFGEYRTAYAFVGLFRILPDFGMSYASTLAISRDRSQAQRLVGGLLGFQAALSVATIALCLAVGASRYTGATWFAVEVLTFDLVLKSVKSTLRWTLKGLERFGIEAVSLLFERTLLLV